MIVRMRARRIFLLGTVLATLLVLALPRALALDPDRRISQYGHTVWRTQDGAISRPTNTAQTTDGFLWITTAQGLIHFDGVRCMPWRPPRDRICPARISRPYSALARAAKRHGVGHQPFDCGIAWRPIMGYRQ
jgi:ligand-binding sensor domain-containing protein